MKIRTLFLLLTGCPLVACAQLRLSLEDAIVQAQENSLLSQEAYHSWQAEEFDYKEWLAGMKTQITLKSNPQYQHSDGLHAFQLDGQVEVTQVMERWGGTFYANTSLQVDKYLGKYATQMRQDVGAAHEFVTMPFQVGYRQDLLGYNPYKWERRIRDFHNRQVRAEHAYELAQIAENTTGYFFAYLSAQSYYEMDRKNAQTADTLYQIGKEKFAISSIRKDELISLELQLLNMQNTLRNAEKSRDIAQETLISYLNLPDSIKQLDVVVPQQPETLLINEEEAIKYALMYNPDYLSQKESLMSQQQNVEKTQKESGLQAALDASVARRNQSSNILTSYNLRQPYTVASVTLSVPLNDQGAARHRRNAAESRLRLQEATLNESARQLREEVVNTLKEFNVEQSHLAETLKAQELADQSYRQNQYNYAQGLIDISTFTLAQERKDEAYNNYIESIEAYWESYYKLRRLTMYDFRNHKPVNYNE